MGRIVATYQEPAATSAAAWILDETDFGFDLEYEGEDISINIVNDAANTGSITVAKSQLQSAPVNWRAPIISGPVDAGWALAASIGVWIFDGGVEPTFTYQWYRNDVAIAGATNATHTTSSPNDFGATFTVGVIASVAGNSSAEAISAGHTLRASAWVQSGALFDGSSILHAPPPANLYQTNFDAGSGLGEGATSLLTFFAGAPTISSGTRMAVSQETDAFYALKNGTFESTTPGEDDGVSRGLNTISGGSFAANDIVACLVYTRQSKPGNIKIDMACIVEGGVWQFVSGSDNPGPLVATQYGSLAVGGRVDGSRFWDGDLYRAAVFPEIGTGLDITDPSLLSQFMQDDTTLTAPDVAQAYLGTPAFDFNGPVQNWRDGVHDGSLGNFTLTGTLT